LSWISHFVGSWNSSQHSSWPKQNLHLTFTYQFKATVHILSFVTLPSDRLFAESSQFHGLFWSIAVKKVQLRRWQVASAGKCYLGLLFEKKSRCRRAPSAGPHSWGNPFPQTPRMGRSLPNPPWVGIPHTSWLPECAVVHLCKSVQNRQLFAQSFTHCA
jgi:hypothetical protein